VESLFFRVDNFVIFCLCVEIGFCVENFALTNLIFFVECSGVDTCVIFSKFVLCSFWIVT
jgi:hypothetical protein